MSIPDTLKVAEIVYNTRQTREEHRERLRKENVEHREGIRERRQRRDPKRNRKI